MGHFSVACAISGTSITHGPTYFLPLIASAKYCDATLSKIQDIPSIVVSNDGALALFKPYSLPILGEYSGYGELENIKDDIASKMFYRYHPDKSLSRDSKKSFGIVGNHVFGETSIPVTGCFIKKWAWDAAIKYSMKRADWPCNTYLSTFISDYKLEAAGFKLIKELERTPDNRYYKVYQKPDFPELKIYSDGQFTTVNENQQYDGIHTFQKLQKYSIEKYGKHIFSKEEVATLSKQNSNELAIQAKITEANDISYLLNVNPNRKFGPYVGLTTSSLRLLVPNLCLPTLIEKTQSEQECQDTIKRCAALISVTNFLYLINKPLVPSFSGPQDGDMDAENYLAKTILKQNASTLKKQRY